MSSNVSMPLCAKARCRAERSSSTVSFRHGAGVLTVGLGNPTACYMLTCCMNPRLGGRALRGLRGHDASERSRADDTNVDEHAGVRGDARWPSRLGRGPFGRALRRGAGLCWFRVWLGGGPATDRARGRASAPRGDAGRGVWPRDVAGNGCCRGESGRVLAVDTAHADKVSGHGRAGRRSGLQRRAARLVLYRGRLCARRVLLGDAV